MWHCDMKASLPMMVFRLAYVRCGWLMEDRRIDWMSASFVGDGLADTSPFVFRNIPKNSMLYVGASKPMSFDFLNSMPSSVAN